MSEDKPAYGREIKGITTEIKNHIDGGLQVWFTIGNQSFGLEPVKGDTDEETIESADFFERMLKVAFTDLEKWQSTAKELAELLEKINNLQSPYTTTGYVMWELEVKSIVYSALQKYKTLTDGK